MRRRLALWVLRWSGALHMWRFLHRRHVVIVSVHGVMDDRDGPCWVPLRSRMPRHKLDEYMRVLSKRYRFVSLRDAVEMLQGRKPILSYCLAITFDDGYRNNIRYALPILRRYGAPATFFLATGYIEQRRPFWFDRVDYALQHDGAASRTVTVGSVRVQLRSNGREELQKSYKELREMAKRLRRQDASMQEEMEGIASAIEAESGRALSDILERDDWTAILTWPEVESLDGEDVAWGSHTVDHLRMGLVDDETARDQLRRSKEMIETHTRSPCLHFCYPNGSFNERSAELVKECGYTCAVTTTEGLNRIGDNLMTLKRIGLPDNSNPNEVLVRVCGLSTTIARLKALVTARSSGRRPVD